MAPGEPDVVLSTESAQGLRRLFADEVRAQLAPVLAGLASLAGRRDEDAALLRDVSSLLSSLLGEAQELRRDVAALRVELADVRAAVLAGPGAGLALARLERLKAGTKADG